MCVKIRSLPNSRSSPLARFFLTRASSGAATPSRHRHRRREQAAPPPPPFRYRIPSVFSIFSRVGYRPTVACVRRLRVGYRQTRSMVAAAAVGLHMAALPFLPACWAIDGLPFSLPELHVGGLPCSLPDVFLPRSSRQCLPAPISRGGGRRCSRGRGGSSRPVLALIRGPAAAACVTIISEGQRHREGRRHVLARGREGRRDDFCF